MSRPLDRALCLGGEFGRHITHIQSGRDARHDGHRQRGDPAFGCADELASRLVSVQYLAYRLGLRLRDSGSMAIPVGAAP
jgi:hypothetical protein